MTEPRASSVRACIATKGKNDGKNDLGIVYSKKPCSVAGVFTTNGVKAAPVRYCQNLLSDPSAKFHGIVANSGNANACTGDQGDSDSVKMASEVARHLNLHSKEILVCSTGRIGVRLPMSKITSASGMPPRTKEELDGAMAFQEAILTSDTCTKSCSAKIETSAGEITVGGVVKGAA